MTPAPRQLTFPLASGPRLGDQDFLVAPANRAAHALATAWPDWPVRAVLVAGDTGTGKSHLASIFAERSGGRFLSGHDLDEHALPPNLADAALAVDDADQAPERALFHLLNAAREQGAWLFLTVHRLPGPDWPRLPDLASRLRALPNAELAPPDDDLMRLVIVKLFCDRQLMVDAEVVDYVARRMERSLAAARHLVAALDEEALARGRRITRSIAADVLARFDETED